MPAHARVWVYQSTRELSTEETTSLQAAAMQFVQDWTAHNNQLNACAEVRYNRFLILLVDEDAANASGCSIDKSVKFVQQQETSLGTHFMDRMNFAYKLGDKVLSCNSSAFEQLLEAGTITGDTFVFNNLVSTKQELETQWEILLKESWHQKLIINH
jgi:hypothetical protein